MKCNSCGMEIADNATFCTNCGATVSQDASDESTTVLMGENMAQPQQPQQPQMGFAQPQQPQQPQMGFAQPQQPQMAYGQPQQPQMGPVGYGQQMPPKPPKKPLTPEQKKKIMIGCIAAGVVAVIAIILAIVLKPGPAKLKGAYQIDDDYVIVFEGSSYVVYADDDYDEVREAGYFKKKGSDVTLYDLHGNKTKGTFLSGSNTFKVGKYDEYESIDKKQTFGFEITEDYLDDLEEEVEDACEAALDDEDVYEDARHNSYYLTNKDLAKVDRDDEFLQALKQELDYENNPDLVEFLEKGYIEIDISVYSDGDVDVNVYTGRYK